MLHFHFHFQFLFPFLALFLYIEQLLEFVQQLPAFASLSVSVRRELCAVMVFAVVERAGTVVLNHSEEVRQDNIVAVHLLICVQLITGKCVCFSWTHGQSF